MTAPWSMPPLAHGNALRERETVASGRYSYELLCQLRAIINGAPYNDSARRLVEKIEREARQ